MRHALDQTLAAFGPTGPDQTIRAVSCWDPHTWNPTSDHSRGRACDLFPTRAGTFPTGTDLANGWHIATWLRAHATALHISYLIWQDRYWSPTTPDTPGNWGIPYDGGGIYNIHDPTGGHYDHIHASVALKLGHIASDARFARVGLGAIACDLREHATRDDLDGPPATRVLNCGFSPIPHGMSHLMR